jgi:hypothetical protein
MKNPRCTRLEQEVVYVSSSDDEESSGSDSE